MEQLRDFKRRIWERGLRDSRRDMREKRNRRSNERRYRYWERMLKNKMADRDRNDDHLITFYLKSIYNAWINSWCFTQNKKKMRRDGDTNDVYFVRDGQISKKRGDLLLLVTCIWIAVGSLDVSVYHLIQMQYDLTFQWSYHRRPWYGKDEGTGHAVQDYHFLDSCSLCYFNWQTFQYYTIVYSCQNITCKCIYIVSLTST